MRKDTIELEEKRFEKNQSIESYPSFHERHRIFPAVFENRAHARVLDVAAGMGVVGKRIKDCYSAELICNDICPTCVRSLKSIGLSCVSFDIDDGESAFPFQDGYFDALIALATIEHVIHLDHFVKELRRLLSNDGCLYISAPNYSGLPYLIPFLLSGRTFHDPLVEPERYEFYAHVRYFTYRTLVEFIESFGFALDTVYLGLPEGSSRFQKMKRVSPVKAFLAKSSMNLIYRTLSPRWASEPVLCFRKEGYGSRKKLRKVVL